MEISSRKEKETLIVSPQGRIDANTAAEFEKSLADWIGRGEKALLLNFQGLEYISSAGLRSILVAAKQLKAQQGEVFFTGLKGSVQEVFKISGFHTLFKIFATEEEALKRS